MNAAADFSLCGRTPRSCSRHADCARAQMGSANPQRQSFAWPADTGERCPIFHDFAPYRNLASMGGGIADINFASPSMDNAVQGTGVPGAAADTVRPMPAPAGDTLGWHPTGEARSVNIGTVRKPCWVVEGPTPTEAARQWTRDIVDALHPISCDTAGDACSERNLGPTPAGESDAGAISPDGLDTTGVLGVTACGGPSSPQDCPEIAQQLRAARILRL